MGIKLAKKRGRRKSKDRRDEMNRFIESAKTIDSRALLIQMLIPIGLKAVEADLQAEVTRLVGERYRRDNEVDFKRWGSNPGAVCLGDQKASIEVPRVRNTVTNSEKPLESYKALQNPQAMNEMVLTRVLHGLSTRNYEQAVQQVPATFGISKSTVSKRFIQASAKDLKKCLERDLSDQDIVAVFIDGKRFAKHQMIIALGITLSGKKVVLGFVESGTENGTVCKEFIVNLKDRGLNIDHEILFIVDGAKGLHKGIKSVMGNKAVIMRCQWHKRENVVSYLGKKWQEVYRRKLQAAYEMPTYEKAKKRLEAIKKELHLLNQSAAHSLEEGLEETLTLHRLGLYEKLGRSFKTTNCIENLNRQLERITGKINNWKNSGQRQRWTASALIDIEPKMHKVDSYKNLNLLRRKMKELNAGIKKER